MNKRYFIFYLLPVILYASFIISLSSISNIPTIRGVITHQPVPKGAWTGDEIEHIIEYSILAFLFYRALQPTKFKDRAHLATIIFIVIFGFLDEVHQYFVPLRTFSILDFFYDTVAGFTTRITAKLLD